MKPFRYIQNANNISKSKINRSIALSRVTEHMPTTIKSTVSSTQRQIVRTGMLEGQDPNTRKVTMTTARVAVPEIMAVHNAISISRTISAIERANLSLDYDLTKMIKEGSFKEITDTAKTMGVNIKEPIIREMGIGKGLHTFSLKSDPREQKEMYDVFNRVAKKMQKNDTLQVDNFEKIKKNVGVLQQGAKKSHQLEAKLSRIQKHKIRRFLRPSRILVKSMQQSESGKGIMWTEQAGRPMYSIIKRLKNLPINAMHNVVIRTDLYIRTIYKYNHTQNITLRGAYEEVKVLNPKLKTIRIDKMLKENPMIRGLKTRIINAYYQKRANYFANKALRNAGSDIAKKMTAKSNLYIVKKQLRSGEITKDLFRQTQAEIRFALRKGTLIGNPLNKMTTGKRAVNKFLVKSKKGIKKYFRRKLDFIFKPIKQVFRKALLYVLGLLKNILAAVISAMGGAAAAVGILLVLAMLILCIVIGNSQNDINTYQTRYGSTDPKQWDNYSKKLFKMLKERHKTFDTWIKLIMAKYPTADVQYPSGSKENYKEIFAAIEIETQYEPTTFSYKEIENIAKRIYDRTHKVKVVPYSFSNNHNERHNSGTDRAARIFVNILRDDTVCYEAFDDIDITKPVNAGGGVNGDQAYASAPVEAAPDDWLSIVQAVKKAIASTGCVYNQNGSIKINVNGQEIIHRPDCSGLIYTCLALYENCKSSAIVNGRPVPLGNTATLQGTPIDGFQVFKWSGWNNLGVGDILVTAGKGHTEIFAGNSNGRHYVWNCGDTYSVQTPGPTTDGGATYGYVYRPNAAGKGGFNAEGDSKGKSINHDDAKAIVGTSMWDPSKFKTPFSNTQNVTFDEKTGNEKGYESALKKTIHEVNQSGNYIYGNSDHMNIVTSSDFIRAILAKHGVEFPFDDERSMLESTEEIKYITEKQDRNGKKKRYINKDEFKVGDIMFYMPKTKDAEALKKKLNNHSYNMLDPLDFDKKVYEEKKKKKEKNNKKDNKKGIQNKKKKEKKETSVTPVKVLSREEEAKKKQGIKTTEKDQATENTEVKAKKKSDRGLHDYSADDKKKTYKDVVFDNAVTLIYDGNKWVAYCKDILAKNEKEYYDSTAKVRYYKSSDFNDKRIITVTRKKGFTSKPIFEHNNYFEGWTDYHVAEFLEIINNKCWEEGEFKLKVKEEDGTVDDMTDAFEKDDSKRIEKFDYSWYKKEIFNGGEAYSSSKHIKETIDDLTSIFIRNYDKWGILPSAGTAYSLSVTNGRSTEESLRYFNIFGNEEDNDDFVDKYHYDKEGNVDKKTKTFKEYTNYHKAYLDWKKGKKNYIFDPNRYVDYVLKGRGFFKQFNTFSENKLIKNGKIDSLNKTYSQLTEDYFYQHANELRIADAKAVKRYLLLKKIKKKEKEWKAFIKHSPYKDSKKPSGHKGTEEEYEKMWKKAENLLISIFELQMFEQIKEGELKLDYMYVTESETKTIEKAIKTLKEAKEKLDTCYVAYRPVCTGHEEKIIHGDNKVDTYTWYHDKKGERTLNMLDAGDCLYKKLKYEKPRKKHEIDIKSINKKLNLAKSHADDNYRK